MESTVDGNLPLSNQQNTLNAAQQAGPYALRTYKKGSPAPTNFASFVDAPLGQDIPNLVLIEVKPNDSIDQIVASRKRKAGSSFAILLPMYQAKNLKSPLSDNHFRLFDLSSQEVLYMW